MVVSKKTELVRPDSNQTLSSNICPIGAHDSRFDYLNVKKSDLAKFHTEPDQQPLPSEAATGIRSNLKPEIVSVSGKPPQELWRISLNRSSDRRGVLDAGGWGRTKGMNRHERTDYLNRHYYSAAGNLRPALDPDYQFRVTIANRGDGYATVSNIDLKVEKHEVWICQQIRCDFDSALNESERIMFKQTLRDAIRERLDAKLEVVETRLPSQGGNIRRKLRLEVKFLENNDDAAIDGTSSAYNLVKVRYGSGRANSSTLYTCDSKGVLAHEMAHRMLAAADEYVDKESLENAPERKVSGWGYQDLLGEEPKRIMNDSEQGRLFPINAKVITSVLRYAIPDQFQKPCLSVAFTEENQLKSTLTREEVVVNQTRTSWYSIKESLSEAFSEAGWTSDYSDHYSRQKGNLGELQRSLCTWLTKRRFEIRKNIDLSLIEPYIFDSGTAVALEEIGKLIGEDRLEEIAMSGKREDYGYRKFAFQEYFLRELAKELDSHLTEEAKRHVGTTESHGDTLYDLFQVLERSASQGMSYFQSMYGERPHAVERVERYGRQLRATTRKAISNL